MLSPTSHSISRPSSRSRSRSRSLSRSRPRSLSHTSVSQAPSRTHRKVDSVITNMGLIVNEIVNKRQAWGRASSSFEAPGTKRKSLSPSDEPSLEVPRPMTPSVSNHGRKEDSPLSDSHAKLQDYIAGQLRKLPPPPLITVSNNNSVVFSESPDTFVFTPGALPSPAVFSSCQTPLFDNDGFQFNFGSDGNSPWCSPISPLATTPVSPPRSPSIESISNNELFQYYLDVPAQRLADTSPSYIDLFCNYIPKMAHREPALMEALLGLAALQMACSGGQIDETLSMRAMVHYEKALKIHYSALETSQALSTDVPLATSIILSHFELWNGELIKMGVHMNGCRDIIGARGKAAHMTPIGRALLAAFRRLDVSSSAISGNPSFQTEDWWTVDPLTRIPIAHDSPPLLAADAAFSKLCVICSKLCHLKAWIIRRRREVHQASLDMEEAAREEKKAALEKKIEQRITDLENSVDAWRKELPPSFAHLPTQKENDGTKSVDGGDDEVDEDINTTVNFEIVPKLYQHKAIALVVAYGIGVDIQLYRLRHPEIPVVCPEIGSKCHTLLRIFSGLPSSCDGAMTAPLFATALELRQKPHQEWLLTILDARITETGFYAMKFLTDGVQYAYSKLDGLRRAPYIRIKEGAAARIDGVSENLWSAEGMMRSMEALSLYEDAESGWTRKVYRGDYEEGDYYAECDGDEEDREGVAAAAAALAEILPEVAVGAERGVGVDMAVGVGVGGMGFADVGLGLSGEEWLDAVADNWADKWADEMADKWADEMADEMADKMADEQLNALYSPDMTPTLSLRFDYPSSSNAPPANSFPIDPPRPEDIALPRSRANSNINSPLLSPSAIFQFTRNAELVAPLLGRGEEVVADGERRTHKRVKSLTPPIIVTPSQ